MNDIFDATPHWLFVYGTLKPGHGNNRLILRGVHKDVGQAHTTDKFVCGQGFPMVFAVPEKFAKSYAGNLGMVKGHLYKVSDSVLMDVDRLEGHPNFYCRTPVTVAFGALKTKVTAGIYLGNPRNLGGRRDLQTPIDGFLEWGRDWERPEDFQRKP